MANGLGGTVLPQIQRIFHSGTLAGLTDGQLLERFATRNDEAAFEALLFRHGPLVLTVCRKLLRDRADVEDAFQATLLVLVRKAKAIRLEASLGPWIYSVAYRVAIRARSNRNLQATRENTVADLDPQAPTGDLDGHDVSPLLHDELARLPERLRAPLVLCYLQGLTHESAAEQLRWPVGTVRSRMARARTLLRERLTRRGVALSAGFLIGSSRQTTAATIPRALSEETIQAAMRIAAGRAALSGALSVPVAALMEGVLNAMGLTKLKTALAAAIVAGFVMTGVVALAVQSPDDKPDEPVPARTEPTVQRKSTTHKSPSGTTYPKTYYVGDLLGVYVKKTGEAGERQKVDFTPLIELITTSVATGAWRIPGANGNDLYQEFTTTKNEQLQPIGSITPFLLSVSLIIRHTAEVHEELAIRFKQWRRLVELHTSNVSAWPESREASKKTVPRPAEGSPAKSGSRARQLIEELEQEIDDLVRERDRLGPDSKPRETTSRETAQHLKDLARTESFSQWIGIVY